MWRKALLLFVGFCLVASVALANGEPKPAAAPAPAVKAHKAVRPAYMVDKGSPNRLQQNVVKILRTTNKAQINRYVPKVYIFKNANPALALRFVRRVVQVEEGLIDTYVAPDGKSGRLLVVLPEYQIPSVDKVVQELDRPGLSSSSGSSYEFVQLKHRSIVADVDGNGVPDLIDQVGHCITNDTDAIPDLETNAVVVSGPPAGVKCACEMAAKLDVPTPQVSVAAKVYEIDTTNDGSIGLDYVSWKNGPGRALFSLGAFGEFEKIDYGHGVNNGSSFDSGAGTFGLPHRRMNSHGTEASYYIDVPSAFFDFLSVKGSGKVLTDSQVSVVSGVPAVFRSVERIPFLQTTEPVPTRTGPQSAQILPVAPGEPLLATGPASINDRRVSGAVTDRKTEGVSIREGLPLLTPKEFEESGVVLWVTPTISLENIDLDVLTSVADLLNFDDKGNPLLSTRVVNSDLRTKNGEEVVLGGITRTQAVKTTRKIPVLGSIPVLGYLFGGEITAKKATMVVEVLKPTIIENNSGLTEADLNAIAQVEGDAATPLPADEYGFDQYMLDPMKTK